MERLHQRCPEDMEGTVFYALAILGTAPETDKTYTKQRKAAALLNTVLAKAPDHPGVAHYLIHSLDYPGLAELALPAARAYSKIAPSAPHAQHMPSHIFTRLGLWEESIQSNLASARASHELMAKMHPGATHFGELHAMDYLTYAYLQLGQDDKAKAVVEMVRAVPKLDQETFAAAYSFAAIPARYALERHQWKEAALLTVAPVWFPWGQFGWAEALTLSARGIGAARSENLPEARAALVRLDTLYMAQTGVKEGYDWADQVEVQRREVGGWIAHAEHNDEAALRQLRSAADLEDSMDKHPVTPGAMLPAREQLADLLVEVGKAAEAIPEYETVLKSSPGRRNSLRGLEQAKRAPSATDSSTERR
jgi:tetratricopeptide (TPR) repeat protein